MMTVDFMRTVDRYIGIPLCLIFSAFDKILKFLPRKKGKTPHKILIIQLSEMGVAVGTASVGVGCSASSAMSNFFFVS